MQNNFKEVRVNNKFIKQSESGDQWFVCKKTSIMDYEIISVHYSLKKAKQVMSRTSILTSSSYKIIRRQDVGQ